MQASELLHAILSLETLFIFRLLQDEMTTHRDLPTAVDNSLAAFVTCALPESTRTSSDSVEQHNQEGASGDCGAIQKHLSNNLVQTPANKTIHNQVCMDSDLVDCIYKHILMLHI